MSSVLPLFDRPTRAQQIQQQFGVFFRENPGVWRRFVELSFRAMNRGHTHYSARTLIEVIRFENDVTSAADEPTGLKINNNFTPYYARLFGVLFSKPDFFERRALTSRARPAKDGDETVARDTDLGDEALDLFLLSLVREEDEEEEPDCEHGLLPGECRECWDEAGEDDSMREER